MLSAPIKVLPDLAKFEALIVYFRTEANHTKREEMCGKLGKLEIMSVLNRKTVLKLRNIFFDL